LLSISIVDLVVKSTVCTFSHVNIIFEMCCTSALPTPLSPLPAFLMSTHLLWHRVWIYLNIYIHLNTYIHISQIYIYICTCIYVSWSLKWCMFMYFEVFGCILMFLYLKGCGYGVAPISRLLQIMISFAEYHLIYRALLQKRPVILRSLIIVATPYVCECIEVYRHIFASGIQTNIYVHI